MVLFGGRFVTVWGVLSGDRRVTEVSPRLHGRLETDFACTGEYDIQRVDRLFQAYFPLNCVELE